MLIVSPGFWTAMLWVALIMWIVKIVWRIDKNVKSISQKLDQIISEKNVH